MAQARSSVPLLRPVTALDARGQVLRHVSLLKINIVIPLLAVAVATATVASRGFVPFDTIIALVFAGGLASAGAACLNHYLDRDIDAMMERTKRRPIPSGAIRHPYTAAFLGAALVLFSGFFGSRLNHVSLSFIALGAFFYVVIYTLWLKRRSPLNVVIGGFAGSCAALAGWTSVEPSLSLMPVLIAALIFLWTPAHFWTLALALKEEYVAAGIPMLPGIIGERKTTWVVFANTTITVLFSLLPFLLGHLGLPYLTMAVIAGLLSISAAVHLLRSATTSAAWLNYRLSRVYLGLLFIGMVIDSLA